MRAVCVDALNPVARPGAERLRNFGLSGVRLVAFDDRQFYKYHASLRRGGIETAVVLTGSSFLTDDYRGGAADYAMVVEPTIWILGNEWNVEGDASWPLGEQAFRDFWYRAGTGIREVQPEAELWIGGLFSQEGLADVARGIVQGLDPTPAGVDIHPYFTTNEELVEIRESLVDVGAAMAVMEWNWDDPEEIPGYASFLDELCDHWAWIPWDDRQIADLPAGLVHRDRKTKYGTALRSYLLG